jgi:hypothetical protein
MNTTSSLFHSINDLNFDSEETDVTSYYRVYEIQEIKSCDCLGVTYSDTEPPVIDISSPPNNSLILVTTIIIIEIDDNFPAIEGGPSFVPEFVLYHWNDATSNTTAYNANTDEPPASDDPVRLEFTLPSNEANTTHVLYLYAVDYEGNWASITFVCTTPGEGEESNVSWTTTTTTTTTERRRTDGFLVIPMILFLIGFVNIITWRKRKQEK